MDTQSIPQSLSLWGWSGSPIPGIGRARHTCLGHPLSSHFLLTITDRKSGHKDSWTVTCILWLMCGRFEPRSVRPKFGCADTSLVGHSWNSMWMVACIHPSPSFPHEVLYVQEVWLWSWPFLRLSRCHHLWLLTSWISVPLFKFLLLKKISVASTMTAFSEWFLSSSLLLLCCYFVPSLYLFFPLPGICAEGWLCAGLAQ